MHPIELISITKRFKTSEKGEGEITILNNIDLQVYSKCKMDDGRRKMDEEDLQMPMAAEE